MEIRGKEVTSDVCRIDDSVFVTTLRIPLLGTEGTILFNFVSRRHIWCVKRMPVFIRVQFTNVAIAILEDGRAESNVLKCQDSLLTRRRCEGSGEGRGKT